MARVAVIQMVSSANSAENLTILEPYFKEAREKQAELVVLPENFAFMGMDEKSKLQIAEPYGTGPIQSSIAKLAKKYGLWVAAGTIPIAASTEKVRASFLLFDSQGDICARYDKIHLFDVCVGDKEHYKESEAVEAGQKLVVVDSPVGKLGLSVCYDLRFPELYLALANQGAEVMLVPSAFTYLTGKAHWQTLLKARAIENLCYVVAANQGGRHENGRTTYGHSMMIDPWGEVLAKLNSGASLFVEDVNLEHLHRIRQKFPTPNHHVL